MTKTQQAVTAFNVGDFKTALKIASTFKIAIQWSDRVVLKRGYECLNYPTTYQQLGFDVEQCIAAAKVVFQRIFMRGDNVNA